MIALPKPSEFSGTHVGRPVNRVDGLAKVTGGAKYAAEFNQPGLLHGVIVSSAIARGKIARIDTRAARAIPGVVEVLTHENRPGTAWLTHNYKDQDAPGGSPFRPLYDDEIQFSDQPIALAIAETLELARHAASQVRVEYAPEPHETAFLPRVSQAREPSKKKPGFEPPPKPRGNADDVYLSSPIQVDGEYLSPAEHHNALELHGTTVVYEGEDRLTIYDKTQGVMNVHDYVCRVFGLSKKDVRVLSPFVGGAFGSGLRPQHQTFLAVLASLALKRSVRVVLTRQQNFSIGHRPETLQRIALGATTDGKIQSIIHEVVGETSRFEDYVEIVTNWSSLLYHSENTRHSYRLVKSDIFTPLDMRAPGGALGVYGIETAIDELAYKAGVDPLEIRLRNYAERDDDNDLPFSSKELRACYAQGAERFGWARRNPIPRSTTAGNKLVGWGMATGAWESTQKRAAARATLTREGKLVVESACADIGTGTYTIMTQIAADALGLPIADVTYKLGDSDFPYSPLEGGSWLAGSVGSAVKAACDKLGEQLRKRAKSMDGSPFQSAADDETEFADGRLRMKSDPTLGVALTDLARAEKEPMTAEVTVIPHLLDQKKYARYTHSAVFVEVHVDPDLGRVQVMRVVSAVAGGRVLNPKTARSQVLGGVVWGIGMALEEETFTDHHLGRFMNHDLAEYHIPVHADVRDIDVIFIPENDSTVNPIGAKGLGEIGIVGVAAAIGNAIFHATGKRLRKLPFTVEKLFEAGVERGP